MKRKVWRVQWNKREECWTVVSRGETMWAHGYTKLEAVAIAVRRARGLHVAGVTSQVVIHTKDGRIQEERTYGLDPQRFAG